MDVKKIRKIKSCKHVDLGKVVSELALLAALLANPAQAMQSNFCLHKVPVDGIEYIVADAKALNRYTHQSGRGNLRYLFDPGTRQYEGIAKEVDNGTYRKVA